MTMQILHGSSSRRLATDLAKVTGTEPIAATVKRFPDGELYLRVERERLDKEVVIVQNSYPDPMLIETLLLQDAARGLGAEKVTCVIPYFGYARQDERFNPGEPISAQVMIRHLELQADKIITVDIHKEYILNWTTKAATKDVKAAPSIGHFFKGSGVELVLAPDEGAKDRAQAVARVLGADSDYLVKTRLSGTAVHIEPSQVDAKGKNVLIVDDIISTGGTIVAATNELKRLGATTVTAACTHGLFVGGALDKLRMSCDRVVSCNTLESDVSEISVADVVEGAL
jgi:ribose-phosphate pyrophosphokinase